MTPIQKLMTPLCDFFVRLGFRVQMVFLLIISLVCFVVPFVLGARRAFSKADHPTVQEELEDWARWIWALMLIIASGEQMDER